MRNAGIALLLLAVLVETARVKKRRHDAMKGTKPINWNKMKEIYRILPKFFDFNERLMKKIMRISPNDLFLIGRKRMVRLAQMFTKEERELHIPCGLYKWTVHVTKEVEYLGTAVEKKALRRLDKALGKKLGPNKNDACAKLLGSDAPAFEEPET